MGFHFSEAKGSILNDDSHQTYKVSVDMVYILDLTQSGCTPRQILKLVIMPQALRIIIPPTTNQYLNLTKNSSLAAAIAYPDLVLVFAGTALMQTGRAIEIVSITMLTYLSISLSISVLMNWYNKKIAIKEK